MRSELRLILPNLKVEANSRCSLAAKRAAGNLLLAFFFSYNLTYGPDPLLLFESKM